jgi:hypothetical protein
MKSKPSKKPAETGGKLGLFFNTEDGGSKVL